MQVRCSDADRGGHASPLRACHTLPRAPFSRARHALLYSSPAWPGGLVLSPRVGAGSAGKEGAGVLARRRRRTAAPGPPARDENVRFGQRGVRNNPQGASTSGSLPPAGGRGGEIGFAAPCRPLAGPRIRLRDPMTQSDRRRLFGGASGPLHPMRVPAEPTYASRPHAALRNGYRRGTIVIVPQRAEAAGNGYRFAAQEPVGDGPELVPHADPWRVAGGVGDSVLHLPRPRVCQARGGLQKHNQQECRTKSTSDVAAREAARRRPPSPPKSLLRPPRGRFTATFLGVMYRVRCRGTVPRTRFRCVRDHDRYLHL